MTWLLTGGSGQLAISIAQLLEKRGTSFVSAPKDEIDISQDQTIEKIKTLKPSVIVNCAAYTAVDKAESEQGRAFEVNAIGARNVARAANELKVPLIHISTDYVFSGEGQIPWTVSDATEPKTQYGKSKLAGEEMVKSTYPEGSWILRTAWLYSPFGKNFAKTILRKALSDSNEVEVVDDQIGQPTCTDDLARHILKVVTLRPVAGTYHATNSGEASWFDFAKEIFKLTGISMDRVVPVKSSQYVTPAKRPAYSVLDHSGWDSVSFEPLQPWRDALVACYPAIRAQVERELRNG
jgi:dTDP-4-dehydrorhamnose reductase